MSGSTTVFNEEQENSLPKWQSDLINQILNAMNDFYCLPDKFDTKKENFKKELINKCKDVNKSLFKDEPNSAPLTEENYKAFISKINEVLHNFDTHLGLEYNPEFIAQMKPKVKEAEHSAKFNFDEGPPKEKLKEWNKTEKDNPKTANFGFIDYQGPAGVIPTNIGYVNIGYLIYPQEGADEINDEYRRGPNAIKRLHEVMSGFQGKEGIVLDLSVTPHGGSPEMVQNIVSFFMPEGTLINSMYDPMSSKELIPYTSISTPFKLLDKPVVLLVGPNTFSGREEITYDLQQYNTTLAEDRFTVIGERTKGGAHLEHPFPLMDMSTKKVNDNLVLHIPHAIPINPVSGTNWEDGPLREGKKPGIQPDIEPLNIKDVLNFALNHLQSMISLRKPQKPDITAAQMASSTFGKGSNTAKDRRGKIWGSDSEREKPAQVAQPEVKHNESQKSKQEPSSTIEYQSPSPFSGAKGLKPPGSK
jgi:hypothetical protein